MSSRCWPNAAYAGTLIGALLPRVLHRRRDRAAGIARSLVAGALFMLLVVLFGLLGANPP